MCICWIGFRLGLPGSLEGFCHSMKPKKEAGSFPKLPFFRGKLAASFRDSNCLERLEVWTYNFHEKNGPSDTFH